MKMKAQY